MANLLIDIDDIAPLGELQRPDPVAADVEAQDISREHDFMSCSSSMKYLEHV